jgi:hypothetical protein
MRQGHIERRSFSRFGSRLLLQRLPESRAGIRELVFRAADDDR